jgi:hypothetical protein
VWLALLLAVVCAVGGLVIGTHYPIAQPFPAAAFTLLVVLFYLRPTGWLWLLPALLPVIDFAPWTGWLTFEEFDVLALAAAAAGYSRWFFSKWSNKQSCDRVNRQTIKDRGRVSVASSILVVTFLFSVMLSMLRGFDDAGGFQFGWFQGYHEPMNSLRLAKSYVLALLLIPIWRVRMTDNPQQTQNLMSLGLVLGLAATSLTTFWERMAYPGLLDFSSDFRTTGFFWEMHVGGAALDGFLVMAMPFALCELCVGTTIFRRSMVAMVLVLTTYAALTTFSRGLYLALPIVAVVFFALRNAQKWHLTVGPMGGHSHVLRNARRLLLGTFGAVAAIAITSWALGSGGYIAERFSTGGRDLDGRLAQWQIGQDMLLNQTEWLFGKGLGRFTGNHYLTGNPSEHPGDYRLKEMQGKSYLTMTGGLHSNSWGQLLRVTQRIDEPGKHPVLKARVRADRDVTLHFEVCEKNLIYGQGCIGGNKSIKAATDVWQTIEFTLEGNGATRGDWYAPRLLAFSMAVDTRGGLVDVSDVSLIRADGRQLLTNGDFANGMSHWFFSSDRYHLPWHIENLFMNLLFDQGLSGLALGVVLIVFSMWRVSFGSARHFPLAPALAASLFGLVIVGLFSSMIEAPRIGWLFYFLLLIAATLPVGQSRSPRRGGGGSPRPAASR